MRKGHSRMLSVCFSDVAEPRRKRFTTTSFPFGSTVRPPEDPARARSLKNRIFVNPPSSSSGLYCAVARQGQDARFPGVEEAPGGEVCWCLPGPSVRVSVCGPWLVLPLLVGSAPGPQVGGVYGPSGWVLDEWFCSVLGGRGCFLWLCCCGGIPLLTLRWTRSHGRVVRLYRSGVEFRRRTFGRRCLTKKSKVK